MTLRSTLAGIGFYAALFLAAGGIAVLGMFLFRNGHQLEAVVFLVGSAAVAGFIIGAREAGKQFEEAFPDADRCEPEHDEYTAPEGGTVIRLRDRI